MPGGLAPQVVLGYDSQAVDGLTSSTNDQASWVGDGWDYAAGVLYRAGLPVVRRTPPGTDQDRRLLLVLQRPVTTLSLGGQTTTLVQDDSTGGWHPADDNGEKIAYETGSASANGTQTASYWVVTDTDGTSTTSG